MILTLLLACREQKLDQNHETGDSPADSPADTSADSPSDTTATCLVLDPTSLALSGNTYSGLVAVSGCVTDLAATCDTVPFTASPSMAVQGSWLINAVGATAPTSGTCVFVSSEGTADLAVSYTP